MRSAFVSLNSKSTRRTYEQTEKKKQSENIRAVPICRFNSEKSHVEMRAHKAVIASTELFDTLRSTGVEPCGDMYCVPISATTDEVCVSARKRFFSVPKGHVSLPSSS